MTAIRSATFADAEHIAAVAVRSWQVGYRDLLDAAILETLSVEDATKQWRGRLLNPRDRASIRVAESEGSVVGFIASGPAVDAFTEDRVGEIYSLYIGPDHWRQGWGGKLLERAVEEFDHTGFLSVILWVLPQNHAARGFYAAHGFRDDNVEQMGSIGELPVPHARYSRLL